VFARTAWTPLPRRGRFVGEGLQSWALTSRGRYAYVTGPLANGLDIFDLAPSLGL
jgi:hypothetical protein